jgi:hypothetical protein
MNPGGFGGAAAGGFNAGGSRQIYVANVCFIPPFQYLLIIGNIGCIDDFYHI